MAILKKGMVPASTLLEVITAMVIIMVVFVLAVGIYNNVLTSGLSIRKIQARALSEKMIAESVNEENWNDERLITGDLLLEKTVMPYLEYNDLVIITVTAFINNKKLSQVRQIVKKTRHE